MPAFLMLLCSWLLLWGCSSPPPVSVPVFSPPPLAASVPLSSGWKIRPPFGWQSLPVRGNPAPVFVSPTKATFLTFYTDRSPLSLQEYVDNQLQYLSRALPQFAIVAQNSVATDQKEPGIEVVADAYWFQRSVRYAYYFISNGEEKGIGLCESLRSDWEKEGIHCVTSLHSVDPPRPPSPQIKNPE